MFHPHMHPQAKLAYPSPWTQPEHSSTREPGPRRYSPLALQPSPIVTFSALLAAHSHVCPAHQDGSLSAGTPLSCSLRIPSSLHSTWHAAQVLLAKGMRKSVPCKCLSLCKVNPMRVGYLWPQGYWETPGWARASPVLKDRSGSL